MNNFTTSIISFVLIMFIMIPIFSTIGLATEDLDPFEPSSSDLWNTLSEFQKSSNLYDMLSSGGWINEDITFKDFDYILVMVDQLCSMYQNVRMELVLAIIAKESRYNQFDEFNGAKGLMQLMKVHRIRMEQFVESGYTVSDKDFYDIRLNLATGIDYLSELLTTTDSDEIYALMCYNQGPTSARKTYIDSNRISIYASDIIKLSEEIRPYLQIMEG